jgi:hypothetical protein
MVPAFLLPDGIAREDGQGAEISLGESCGQSLLLTLSITRILEQASLDVSIWGSADGHIWQPLVSFPQKFYCGTYSLLLDLSRRREIRYLRAQWRTGRWGGRASKPLFGFRLLAEQAKMQVAGAAW